MMSRKNITLFQTEAIMLSKYRSVGTMMLMAPPTSPIFHPSFGWPVGSISPAGSPWHSVQSLVTRISET